VKSTFHPVLSGLAFLSALILLLQPATGRAQGTAFTYQGRLDAGGGPYTGLAEMQFSLWDAASGGNQLGGTLTFSPVGVTNGLFSVSLDFGNQFTGANRWLEIALRTNLLGFTTLSPRQPLTATPYAITAGNLTGTLPASQLSGLLPGPSLGGTYPGAVTFNNAANSFTGSGAGLTGLNASQLTSGTVPEARLGANLARTNQVWLLGGNAGTTPGTHFLGTTDNQPVEMRVNGQRALRLEPNTNNAPNVIGGYAGNYVPVTVVGATIAGGGARHFLNFSYPFTNCVLANFGTVGGGLANTASGQFAIVGGGWANVASGGNAAVGGGWANIASDSVATVAGGSYNTASGTAATVAGGMENIASGWYAAVVGGWANTAGGLYTFVGGGRANIASNYCAFAAGRNARAVHDGSFVWSSYDSPSPSFGSDTFFVNAPNGLGINCGAQRLDGGGQYWMNFGRVASGGQLIETSVGATLSLSGVWQNASDQNRKTDFVETEPREVLEKLVALPVRQWRYTNEPSGVKHIGPTAQEFKAAFGLGHDERSIGTVDADGVALAAIQGLNQKVEDRSQKSEARIEKLEAENAALKAELAELKQLVRALAARANGGGQ